MAEGGGDGRGRVEGKEMWRGKNGRRREGNEWRGKREGIWKREI